LGCEIQGWTQHVNRYLYPTATSTPSSLMRAIPCRGFVQLLLVFSLEKGAKLSSPKEVSTEGYFSPLSPFLEKLESGHTSAVDGCPALSE
jgi:hypothetical protein